MLQIEDGGCTSQSKYSHVLHPVPSSKTWSNEEKTRQICNETSANQPFVDRLTFLLIHVHILRRDARLSLGKEPVVILQNLVKLYKDEKNKAWGNLFATTTGSYTFFFFLLVTNASKMPHAIRNSIDKTVLNTLESVLSCRRTLNIWCIWNLVHPC